MVSSGDRGHIGEGERRKEDLASSGKAESGKKKIKARAHGESENRFAWLGEVGRNGLLVSRRGARNQAASQSVEEVGSSDFETFADPHEGEGVRRGWREPVERCPHGCAH